ncbi:hybrid sensor histidine kinase/response regulator [Frateuria hangzhouensis]|uniref:hybrid sensor histidine kinase/response regulator n=1 Tax=Frateuria hangzhouensis TaxID=2995589 RepID=UPI002260A2AD|nr:PAS domain-containing protein [Frateuria sp. STR12]MCX7514395.1 PAS domain-containing protein [Frateuria sp. STR12]
MQDRAEASSTDASADAPLGSEAHLELATRVAQLGIWDWNLRDNSFFYSPRAREICGLPQGDEPLRMEQLQARTHPEDLPRTHAMLLRALDPAIRERLPYEYRVVHEDGQVRWVVAHGEAMFATVDGAERAVRYIGTLQDVTERRRLGEALEASRTRLQLAIDAGRMAVWEADLRNDTLVGSPELNRLLGFPADAQPTREQIRAGNPPGERERVEACARAALARGERFIETEYRYIRPDGEPCWLLLRAELQLEDGEPVRAVGVLMDVTGCRRAEEALRSSEARLKLAQRIGNIGVWEWELPSGDASWSREMYELFGLDPEAGITPEQAWLAQVYPEDRVAVDEAVLRSTQSGQPVDIEFRIRVDGQTRWIRSRGTPATDPDGTRRMIGVNQDVTSTHHQRATLEARNRDLQEAAVRIGRERERVFELSRDLFAVAGFDGYLKTINPAWTCILGYDEANWLTRPLLEFVHPEDRAGARAVLDCLERGDAAPPFECRLRCDHGGWRWIAWTAVAEGESIYVVGRDVTHEKIAAQELEAANRQLRNQIEGRERVEATLRQMQRLEAVGQLTSGVAHDFNNLLTIVLGNLDLIEMAVDDPQVRRRLDLMRKAALRGATLTSQLLAFSRRQRLETKVVDLNGTVQGMSELLKSTMGGSIDVTTRLQPDLWSALVDPTQIELVILNLAINARDAMPVGGGLTIETSNAALADEPRQPGEPVPGDYVAITVIDTGSGMTEEVRAHAFEPFFTTKAVGKGSGLGLAQVLGFAQQSGGGVGIESRSGEGTTIRVYLPRAYSVAVGGISAPETREHVEPLPQRRYALLVDDDNAVRDVTAARLRQLGFEVLEAGSGGAALDLLERTAQVDLLVADFAMPGMNGVEVAQQARTRRPGLPVLFVTGYADQTALAGIGDERVVQKPFRDDELERKVRAVIGR